MDSYVLFIHVRKYPHERSTETDAVVPISNHERFSARGKCILRITIEYFSPSVRFAAYLVEERNLEIKLRKMHRLKVIPVPFEVYVSVEMIATSFVTSNNSRFVPRFSSIATFHEQFVPNNSSVNIVVANPRETSSYQFT